jgi:hypothetical protein
MMVLDRGGAVSADDLAAAMLEDNREDLDGRDAAAGAEIAEAESMDAAGLDVRIAAIEWSGTISSDPRR